MVATEENGRKKQKAQGRRQKRRRQ